MWKIEVLHCVMISGRKLIFWVGICQHSYGKTKHGYKLMVLFLMHIFIIFNEKKESVHMTDILTWMISIINHNDNESYARIQHVCIELASVHTIMVLEVFRRCISVVFCAVCFRPLC